MANFRVGTSVWVVVGESLTRNKLLRAGVIKALAHRRYVVSVPGHGELEVGKEYLRPAG